MNVLKIGLLLLLSTATSVYGQRCAIYFPVSNHILKTEGIKQVEKHVYQDNASKPKVATGVYKISPTGCPSEYRGKSEASEGIIVERETFYSKNGPVEYAIYQLQNGKEVLLERKTEYYTEKNLLAVRKLEQYYGLKEIRIDSLYPNDKNHFSDFTYKIDGEDTVRIIININELNYKFHVIKEKINQQWIETEKSISHFENDELITYELYKNGQLRDSYKKSKKDRLDEELLPIGDPEEYPLPIADQQERIDYFYCLLPYDHNQKTISSTQQKDYKYTMHVHYQNNNSKKISYIEIYDLKGLLYHHYNHAEVVDYKYYR